MNRTCALPLSVPQAWAARGGMMTVWPGLASVRTPSISTQTSPASTRTLSSWSWRWRGIVTPGSTQLRSTLTLLAPCSWPDSQRPVTPVRITISGNASLSTTGMLAPREDLVEGAHRGLGSVAMMPYAAGDGEEVGAGG